jgi:signal transduction histidine kinase/CheY-like chemotaxis protein
MVDSSRRAEVQVAAVVEEIQSRMLRLTRPYVVVGIPVYVVAAASELLRGHVTVWIVSEPIVVVLMALAFRASTSTRRVAAAQCLGLTALSTAGLLHYGPLLGTGLLFALSVLEVSFFFGRRVVVGTAGYLLLLMVAAAAGASRGWAPAWWPGALTVSDWARLVAAALIMLGALAVAFENIQASMRVSISNEVTARFKQQEAEEERERAVTAAMTAQRLETLGELAAGVAHDTNNTLAVIQGALEALASASSEERGQLVAEGLAAVKTGSGTARRLLGLARRSAEDVGHCDPVAVIDATASAVRRVLPAGFAVSLDMEPCPDAAISDGVLEQVLLNLIVNARDATGGRGRVDVRCRHEGGHVRIGVADDGPGMTAEVRARVFEPFFTTKARGEGTGLGLSLVSRLLHNAGGSIDLETAVGKGASFTIVLPVAAPPSVPPSVAPPVAGTQPQGGRVLVVEDDPQVSRLLKRILERAKYDVTVAASVGEASKQLEAASRYDLLITDGQLPDGNAGGVLAAYRVHHGKGPVIVCTGYLDDKEVISQVEKDSKSSVFLHKPFATDDLLHLTSRLIRKAQ